MWAALKDRIKFLNVEKKGEEKRVGKENEKRNYDGEKTNGEI